MSVETTCPTCGIPISGTLDFLKCKAAGMDCAPKLAHADAMVDATRPVFEKDGDYVNHLLDRMWSKSPEELNAIEVEPTEQLPAASPPEQPDVPPAVDPKATDGGFLHTLETVEDDIKKWFRK